MENGYGLMNKYILLCDCKTRDSCQDQSQCFLVRNNGQGTSFTMAVFFTGHFDTIDSSDMNSLSQYCARMSFKEAESVLIQSMIDWLVMILLVLYLILRFVCIYFMLKFLQQKQSKKLVIGSCLLVVLFECALNGSCFAILLYDYQTFCVKNALLFKHELGPLENIIGTLQIIMLATTIIGVILAIWGYISASRKVGEVQTDHYVNGEHVGTTHSDITVHDEVEGRARCRCILMLTVILAGGLFGIIFVITSLLGFVIYFILLASQYWYLIFLTVLHIVGCAIMITDCSCGKSIYRNLTAPTPDEPTSRHINQSG